MLGPYREVLRVPGAVAFVAAGLVARLPISMQTLGVVLLVEATTGSYALAGAVSAVFALAQALLAPVLGRLVDRHGQARVLLPALVLYAAGLGGLVALALADAPSWTLFPAAAVVRRQLPAARLAGPGPLGARAVRHPAAADRVLAGVGARRGRLRGRPGAGDRARHGGVARPPACCPRRSSRWSARSRWPRSGAPSRRRTRSRAGRAAAVGAAAAPACGCSCWSALAVGGIFGSVEVATVAFTDERGQPAAAGIVLALLAGGSLLAGLWYGTVRVAGAAARPGSSGASCCSPLVTVPLPLAPNVPVLAALVFVGGFTISPTLIAAFALLEELVPAPSRTEGLTWFSTGIGIGLAAAASVTGQVVDAASGRAAFGVAVGSGVLAAVLALAGARQLTPAG